MDLTKEAIEKIESLVTEREKVEINGAVFSAANLKRVFTDVFPPPVEVGTLSGFCRFVNANIDKMIDAKNYFIHVAGHKSVLLCSELSGESRYRTTLLKAELPPSLSEFDFGKFMAQEEFLIKLHSLFQAQANTDLEYVSRVVSGTNLDVADDGVSQTVQVRRGVAGVLKDKETLKPIVRLAPYRTFREIVQPVSEFLLRLKLNNNEAPYAALFEADGGTWTLEAVKGIADYIKDNLAEEMPLEIVF